jgi:hypothetical protein
MEKVLYKWKRFWCAPSGRINLSDSGFLVDPDGEYGTMMNPDVVPWDAISTNPCLVLLGEPGIGKSAAMNDEHKHTAQACQGSEDQVVWVDLRSYHTDQRLHAHVFESPVFAAWRGGTFRLHLFLDSMDECLMRIENIGPVLLNEFKDLPVERLSVRIACRTADWPRGIESELQHLWGGDNIKVYELAPLRRVDVFEAAEKNEIKPPHAFVDEVLRRDAVPLAIKPVTLGLLVNTYKRRGGFPATQAELYGEGCRLLCEEPRQGRRPAKAVGELAAEERLAVATRIAALTTFCQRDAIWTEVDRGDVPAEDIRIREILGGTVGKAPAKVEVVEDAVWQALNTGLFSSRGAARIGWAHQTYSEFLAARFLIESDFSTDRVMSLLLHPDGKIVPQLHETAAWLSSMIPDVFRRIMAVDPQMLLWSDAGTSSTKDRMDLVESLLHLFDNGRLFDLDWDLRRRYRKLDHPGLPEQLRPYIRDKGKGVVVRRAAIGIAESCEVASLEPDLIDVSLDQTDAHEIRVTAAFAISQFGTAGSKRALRPLALGAVGSDPDDDLKGCGLICAWPESLSATELFGALTRRNRPNRIGMYDTFLRRDIAQEIPTAELPAALRWTEREQECGDSISPFARHADAIRARALDHLNVPYVADALASATWKWLQADGLHPSDSQEYKRKLALHEDQRRHLVLHILPLAGESENQTFHLCYGQMIMANDFPWLLERLHDAPGDGLQKLLLELLKRTFDDRESGHRDCLMAASRHSQMLAVEFAWFLDPESPDAEALRRRRTEWANSTPKISTLPPVDPPPDVRIAILLDRFEAGDLDAFVSLNRELTLEPDSARYGNPFEVSLNVLPGWKRATAETKERIVAAAKRFLAAYTPQETSTWIKSNSFPWATLAGYRALLLLLTEAPAYNATLSPASWERWASIALAYPLPDGNQIAERRQHLLKLAYEKVPGSVLGTLASLIDKENNDLGILFMLERMLPIWDVRLAAALVEKIGDASLKPGVFGAILGELLKHGVDEAGEIAKTVIGVSPPPEGEPRERAVVAAQALMRNADDAGWDIVWPVVALDSEFGIEVFTGIGSVFEAQHAATGRRLTDDQITELYIWLATKVPHRNDNEDHGGFGFVSPIQSLGWWRDSLLNQLKTRGTARSCAGMRRAVRDLPQYPWLSWHLMEAEQITRRYTWSPLVPTQLLVLAASPEHRLVQNGEQLLGILIESLKRLERELQGETPAAIDLWNEVKKNTYRPKDEPRLSDYVKRHFERDIKDCGVVVNREVEIRRGEGTTPGEETDIHVDAVTQLPDGAHDRISVIVEAKGCWNRGLMTAMETQLVDRYLKDNACPFGLYLVGWFVCAQWDPEDYRRNDTQKTTLDEARAVFDKQAAGVSNDTRRVAAFVLNLALR